MKFAIVDPRMKLLHVFAILLWPGVAMAEIDFRDLTPEERRILRAEIRAVLIENPHIFNNLLNQSQPSYPAPAYQEEIAADHALIARHADSLFDEALPGFGPPDAEMKIAMFTSDSCASCKRAEDDLRDLSVTYQIKVMLIDRTEHNDLAVAMGVEELPFYVMPKMMIQGHMPAPIIARYLEQGTGQ